MIFKISDLSLKTLKQLIIKTSMVMKNNSKKDPLLQLRKSIDNIDNQIIDLLNERIDIILKVSDYKKSIKDKFFIKSAREADMIKNLVSKANPNFPKSTIVNIWRKIITSANVLEQNLIIDIHNPNQNPNYEHLVKEYYGDFVPVNHRDNANDIIADLEKETIRIGVFALTTKSISQHWWLNLANNNSKVKIFAKIPFIRYKKDQNQQNDDLFIAAIKDAEKSEDDNTLLSIELDNNISKTKIQNILAEVGLKGEILESAKIEQVSDVTFYLLQLEGFFDESSDKIKLFLKSEIKPFGKIIGHYPKPIIV
jgi:chorismate mutase